MPPRARGARARTATARTPAATTSCIRLLGVEAITVVPGGSDLAAAMQKVADEVAALGRKAYVIPGGGSNPLGRARLRVVRRGDPGPDLRPRHPPRPHRLRQRQRRHAGGARLSASSATTATSRSPASTCSRTRQEQEPKVHKLAAGDGRDARGSRAASRARRSRRSATGSAPATRCRRPRWSRRCGCWRSVEGILLDPVYTGKAMAGLIGLVRQGDSRRASTCCSSTRAGRRRSTRISPC